MPRVTIELVEGRTLDQKRAMAKEISESIIRICNVEPRAVTIYFDEMKKDCFSKAGIMECDH